MFVQKMESRMVWIWAAAGFIIGLSVGFNLGWIVGG
jgi:hypothetical protein